MNLVISYYKDKNQDREQEINQCLLNNVSNPNISRVIHLSKRPTYYEAFQEMGKYGDEICILANSDIYFDETIKLADKLISEGRVCFALTRWDVLSDGTHKQHIDRGSQDVWIMKGSVAASIPKDKADFYLGTPGCDNRIAAALNECGVKVYNPSNSIKTLHLHNSQIRNYTRKDVVLGAHLLLSQTGIEDYDKTEYFHRSEREINDQFGKDKVVEAPREIAPVDNNVDAYLSILKSFKPRLLYIGVCHGENGFTAAMKKHFDYHEVDFRAYSQHPGGLNHDVMHVMNTIRPEVVFMQLQAEGVLTPATVSAMSEIAKIINFTGDKRDAIPTYLMEHAPYCITTMVCEEDVALLKQQGFKAEYLPYGFDPNIFNTNYPLKEGPEIVFMANNYGQFPMSQFRAGAVDRLKTEFKDNFAIFGNGWAMDNKQLNDSQAAEAHQYTSAKIAINISHYNTERYTSDRLYRLMTSGPMCLSFDHKGLRKDFNPGQHLDVFSNFEEMLQKCRMYLANNDARNRIAEAGRKLVNENFTFDKMAENIKRLYLN